MSNKFNPKRLDLARAAWGMTQVELAKAVGEEQSAISKVELGIKEPSDPLVSKLALTLKVTREFFYENSAMLSAPVHYRKVKRIAAKDLSIVESRAFIKKEFVNKLLKTIDIELNFQNIKAEDVGDAATVATQIRAMWGVPRGPIPHLINLVENAGIIILPLDYQVQKLDGFVIPDTGKHPMIALNIAVPPDRLRFTLAHELGHCVMHLEDYNKSSDEAHEEANEFAGEFLMPWREFQSTFIDAPAHKLFEHIKRLKAYWKCSMAAIIYRAHSLGLIDDKKQKSLMVMMSQRQYRTVEPMMGIPIEKPSLFDEIVNTIVSDQSYTRTELQTVSGLSPEWYQTLIESPEQSYSDRFTDDSGHGSGTRPGQGHRA